MRIAEAISESVNMFSFIFFSILSSSECLSRDHKKNRYTISAFNSDEDSFL